MCELNVQSGYWGLLLYLTRMSEGSSMQAGIQLRETAKLYQNGESGFGEIAPIYL